jgi:radical SAM-linked protein
MASAVQRLRLRYAKGESLRYISHLDLMRLWERAFRRADLPVAHTQGFNPRPRILMACPLPTGVTSRGEVLDVLLTQRLDSMRVLESLRAALPAGIETLQMQEVPLGSPALMAMRAVVEYQARIETDASAQSLEARLSEWMAQDTVVRERQRKGRTAEYDLRPLVERLWLVGRDGDAWIIGMRLKAEPGGTGRPDEMLKALNLWEDAGTIERTALTLLEE